MVLSPHERSSSNETRNCSTTIRIQHVERDNSTVVYQAPCSTDDDTVFLRGGSPESGGSSYVFGVQSISIRRKVFFDTDNITVFTHLLIGLLRIILMLVKENGYKARATEIDSTVVLKRLNSYLEIFLVLNIVNVLLNKCVFPKYQCVIINKSL